MKNKIINAIIAVVAIGVISCNQERSCSEIKYSHCYTLKEVNSRGVIKFTDEYSIYQIPRLNTGDTVYFNAIWKKFSFDYDVKYRTNTQSAIKTIVLNIETTVQ